MRVIATGRGQHVALGRRFDPLRHHLQAELVRHCNDRAAQRQVARVGLQLLHERGVDLEVIDIEFLQARQRKITAAEVVQRHLQTHCAELAQALDHVARFVQQDALGNFNHDRTGRQALLFQVIHPILVKRGVAAKFHRRLVDANLEGRRQLVLPALDLLHGLAKHPIADFSAESAGFGERQELGRGEQAALRVAPAQQGFGPFDGAAAQADDGLVMDFELLSRQRYAQVKHGAQAQLGGRLQIGRKIAVAVAPGAFGRVHGLVGVAQQVVDVGRVGRIQRDADAGRHLRPLAAQLERPRHAGHHVLRDALDAGKLVEAGQDHGEFIAAQARHGVAAAHALDDAAGDLAQ